MFITLRAINLVKIKLEIKKKKLMNFLNNFSNFQIHT